MSSTETTPDLEQGRMATCGGIHMNMAVVIGGPAIAAVLIGAGLIWATNVAADSAAAERKAELVAQGCADGSGEILRQPCQPD